MSPGSFKNLEGACNYKEIYAIIILMDTSKLDELTRLTLRVMELEKLLPSPPPPVTDYGTTILSLKQDILKLEERINVLQVLYNAQNGDLKHLKAGVDTCLTQTHIHSKKFKFW